MLAGLATLFASMSAFFARKAQAAQMPTAQKPGQWPEIDKISQIYSATEFGNLTRGERNNNPGNIELGAQWNGAVTGTDPRFVVFSMPEYGIRAMATILKTYKNKYGIYTIRNAITRWAPPEDNNDTEGYIRFVANSAQISPTAIIDLANPDIAFRIIKPMIIRENGRVIYADSTIRAGIEMA